MHLRFLWHSAWLTRIGLQGVFCAVLIWRRFYREFPWFLLFTAAAVIQSVILAAMVFGHLVSGRAYFDTYRIGISVETALCFAVLYELLKRIIRDFPVLSGVSGSLYRLAAVSLMLMALVLAWYAPATAPGKYMASFFVLQRTSRLLQCGLLIFLFVFARSFGLSWRNRAFGIAFGFGVSAAMSLINATIRVRIQPVSWNRTDDILTLMSQLGDLAGVLIWMAYLLPKETKGNSPPPTLPKTDLEAWNRELRRLVP